MYEGSCREKAYQGKDNISEGDQKDTCICSLVSLFEILGAESLGKNGIDTYAGTAEEIKRSLTRRLLRLNNIINYFTTVILSPIRGMVNVCF